MNIVVDIFTGIGIATVTIGTLLLVLGLWGLFVENRKRRRFEDSLPPLPSQLRPHTAWPVTDHRPSRDPGSEQDPDS